MIAKEIYWYNSVFYNKHNKQTNKKREWSRAFTFGRDNIERCKNSKPCSGIDFLNSTLKPVLNFTTSLYHP
jgi:hypothetical protein